MRRYRIINTGPGGFTMASNIDRQRSSIWIQLIICFPFPSIPRNTKLTGFLNCRKCTTFVAQHNSCSQNDQSFTHVCYRLNGIFPCTTGFTEKTWIRRICFNALNSRRFRIPSDGRCTDHRFNVIGNLGKRFYQQFTAFCPAFLNFLFSFFCPGFICYTSSGQMNNIFCFSDCLFIDRLFIQIPACIMKYRRWTSAGWDSGKE